MTYVKRISSTLMLRLVLQKILMQCIVQQRVRGVLRSEVKEEPPKAAGDMSAGACAVAAAV